MNAVELLAVNRQGRAVVPCDTADIGTHRAKGCDDALHRASLNRSISAQYGIKVLRGQDAA